MANRFYYGKTEINIDYGIVYSINWPTENIGSRANTGLGKPKTLPRGQREVKYNRNRTGSGSFHGKLHYDWLA
jgi:hypothetical protein